MRTVHKQLAFFEAFRRLGFPSERLYVAWSDNEPVTILRAKGNRMFVVNYPGTEHGGKEEWMSEWKREAERWNQGMTDDERDKIYLGGVGLKDLIGLVSGMRKQGIQIPNLSADTSAAFDLMRFLESKTN